MFCVLVRWINYFKQQATAAPKNEAIYANEPLCIYIRLIAQLLLVHRQSESTTARRLGFCECESRGARVAGGSLAEHNLIHNVSKCGDEQEQQQQHRLHRHLIRVSPCNKSPPRE